ncbi:outer membrane beta-barrel domain protein [Campylobacter iguaniorum]|uniref:hypothetical protein n=1 Tax=Campylobacter iguaniorum TaxID=1244531 RepID=UPI00073A1F9F|nr:hypothetical protein [Campylobacter iguaniorum]ALV24387.1 outer membrane beta-barrel domain protein [Campylobacter iguaniorum]
MKNSILKIGIAVSITCAFAMGEGAFIGVESDYSFESNLKTKDEINSANFKDNQVGIGLKAGYDFDIYRVYGSYIYDLQAKDSIIDEDGDPLALKWNTHKFIIGAEYTPVVANDLKLAIGGYTGMSILKMKVNAIDENEKDDIKGWIIGAKLGGIYAIDESNEVEFGLKADRTDYGKSDKSEMKDAKETNYGFYLGYNYKF